MKTITTRCTSQKRRGADVGSDHHLVVTDIKLKFGRTGSPLRMLKQLDVSRLNDTDVRKQFMLKVRNRLAALENVDEEGNTVARCKQH